MSLQVPSGRSRSQKITGTRYRHRKATASRQLDAPPMGWRSDRIRPNVSWSSRAGLIKRISGLRSGLEISDRFVEGISDGSMAGESRVRVSDSVLGISFSFKY